MIFLWISEIVSFGSCSTSRSLLNIGVAGFQATNLEIYISSLKFRKEHRPENRESRRENIKICIQFFHLISVVTKYQIIISYFSLSYLRYLKIIILNINKYFITSLMSQSMTNNGITKF
eukprot:XP_014767644.1 PREDICTED: uncharacterized protein LOC106867318 [Octopus bimaculoides]